MTQPYRIDIEQIRGDTFEHDFPQTNTNDATNVWFTLKDYKCESDADAIVQVDETTGLLVLNGVVAPNPALASIIRAGRVITVWLDASITTVVSVDFPLIYDVQLKQGDDIRTAFNGRWRVVSDVTKTITPSTAVDAVLWPEGGLILWPEGDAVLWP